ncbi:MAG: UPF0158 family protein [Euryarchaeota archaeon]|nr:UPF0158 family protein [Euryarchaeota archaeon]
MRNMGVEKMKLNIDFEKLVEAFEESDITNHFFIDTQTSKILCINEAAEVQVRKKLNQLNNDRYFPIPSRNKEEHLFLRELFIYQHIHDESIAEKFHQTLERKKSIKDFNELLQNHPNLNEQWFTYEYDHIKNEVITWLCEHNIELENQNLTPTILIKELTSEEIQHMPDEIKDFKPYACLRCHNKKGMKTRIFSINISPENKLIEQETQRIMKEQFGITHHGGWSGGAQEFLTASRCMQCGSEEIFWDY